MNRDFRTILFVILILAPIVFYHSFIGRNGELSRGFFRKNSKVFEERPRAALIITELGASMKDLKKIYKLDIPLTISVIPGLKFSKNIAYIGARCGYSVLIHLPLSFKSDGNNDKRISFVSSSLSQRENKALLRYYLNFVRIAAGVSVYKEGAAADDIGLMGIVMRAIKRKNLIFIDSETSDKPAARAIAKEMDVLYKNNDGFLDEVDTPEAIKTKLDLMLKKARKKGKVVFMCRPLENTLRVLKENLPALKEKIDFVTIKKYFEL